VFKCLSMTTELPVKEMTILMHAPPEYVNFDRILNLFVFNNLSSRFVSDLEIIISDQKVPTGTVRDGLPTVCQI